jgi:DNA-binding XRE family transcriptional regulator
MLHKQYKSIPNKLRMHRLAMGWEQVEVAKMLGLKSTSKLSHWENGDSLPNLVNAFKLAGLYRVYVEALFYDMFDTIRSEVTASAEREMYPRSEGDGGTGTKLST